MMARTGRAAEPAGASVQGKEAAMADPVVHFELMGMDRDVLDRFYGELFGWHLQSMPEPPYSVIDTHAGGGINGGIGSVDDQSSQYVAVYAQTQDINATFDKAVSLGAEVLVPVSEVPGIVTLALLRDPQGNTFGMVSPGEGPGVSSGDGVPVEWFEILGPQPKALRDFYVELFGWEPFGDDAGGGYEYYQVHTGKDGLDGGIGSSPDGKPHVTLYATVDDLSKYLEQAESLGGATVMPPTSMENIEFAQFRDPQGNVFGLYRRL
jgi:predicted enzyme related to lactoylglutathione lyase